MSTNRELLKQIIAIHERRSSRVFFHKKQPRIGVGFKLNWPDADKVLATVCKARHSQLLQGKGYLKPEQIDRLFDFGVETAIGQCVLLFPYFTTYPDNVQAVLCDIVFDIGYAEACKLRQFNACIANYRYDVAAFILRKNHFVLSTKERVQDGINLLMEAHQEETQPVEEGYAIAA